MSSKKKLRKLLLAKRKRMTDLKISPHPFVVIDGPPPQMLSVQEWDHQYVMDNLRSESGGDGECPVCHRKATVYPYKLHSTLVRCLIELTMIWESNGNQWVNVNELSVRTSKNPNNSDAGADLAWGKQWGLIEPATRQSALKKREGFWRPTKLGVDFVHDRVRVPSHAWLFGREVHAWSVSTINVVEALGERFDYLEVMGME